MCHHRGDRLTESEGEREGRTERESWWGVHGADRLRAMVAGRNGESDEPEAGTPEYPAVELAKRGRRTDESASDRDREETPVPTDD